MHRLLVGAEAGVQVDHINGDRLDNRKLNLRVCTQTQNSRNMKKRSGTSSQFKGVCWDKNHNRWVAYIDSPGRKNLGSFDDEIQAALAYDRAARNQFGEFAKVNFP